MARPREFDIDEALDGAMTVFWEKGYEGASLQDLLSAMKIARGSLYKAFEDKHSIYLAALDRYDQQVVANGVAALNDAEQGDGLDRIRRMFQAVTSDKVRQGCFMCNAATDQAHGDQEVQARIQAMLQRLQDALVCALTQSRRGMRWSKKRRADTASYLLNAYVGLRVLARARQSKVSLQAIIDKTLDTI